MSNRENATVTKPIQSIMFTAKAPGDQPVLQKINELADVLPGINPKAALKNFLLRALPPEIARLRANGGQLLAS